MTTTLAEIRQIESEIMAHEAAIVELRARMREMMDLGSSRRPSASSSRRQGGGLSREQLQRLLRARPASASGAA